ncbi:hypothetical protein protein [Babesia ovis]|uniref:Chaperonin n=1 Tax=Babesia ovis TaxID=5869 RepID=A0A9W5T932_BABOV|nr:hypothetical protein protein [Babesia ovis]
MYMTMSKVLVYLFIAQVARALCIRTGSNAQTQRANAFILPSANTAVGDSVSKRFTSQGAEPVSSSNEKLPYGTGKTDIISRGFHTGYLPKVNPGDIKYMGHPIVGEIKPANNYVLIAKTVAHEYSAGGVYVGAKPNKEFAGKVIAVGPGRLVPETGAIIPMSLKVGDIVLYEPPEEQPVLTYKKQECVLLPEDQVYAVVETDGNESRNLAAEDIRPLSDRLLVRVIDSPKKTQSGLVLANANGFEKTTFRATVIDIGPGSYTENGKLLPVDEFQKGDIVLFSDSAADGGEFNLNRTQYAFVRRSAIVAKV